MIYYGQSQWYIQCLPKTLYLLATNANNTMDEKFPLFISPFLIFECFIFQSLTNIPKYVFDFLISGWPQNLRTESLFTISVTHAPDSLSHRSTEDKHEEAMYICKTVNFAVSTKMTDIVD